MTLEFHLASKMLRERLNVSLTYFSYFSLCFRLLFLFFLNVRITLVLCYFYNFDVPFTEAATCRCSSKELFLKMSQKFSRKYLCWSLFLIKLHAFRPSSFIKKILQHRCFPVNFLKCLRTSFFIEHLWWLLLHILYFPSC